MPQHAGGCGYQEAMSAYRSPSSAAAPDTCARSSCCCCWELGVSERSCWSFHCMKKEQKKEEEEEEQEKI